MKHEFPVWNIPSRNNEEQDYLSKTQKVVFRLLSRRIFLKLFVNSTETTTV